MNRHLASSALAAAVLLLPLSFVGCDRASDNTTASTPANPGPAERAGRDIDNAGRNTADAARDAADRTSNAAHNTANDVRTGADRTAADSATWHNTNPTAGAGVTTQPSANAGDASSTQPSHMPGLPSVTGTDTGNMSTADAAAQRLIDNARNNLKQNDISKARTLLTELKEKGMYDSLSQQQKANVDQLERDLNAAPTAQENK